MGTQSSHYCYCNKVITLNKDILLTSSTEPIIKLNRIFVNFSIERTTFPSQVKEISIQLPHKISNLHKLRKLACHIAQSYLILIQ